MLGKKPAHTDPVRPTPKTETPPKLAAHRGGFSMPKTRPTHSRQATPNPATHGYPDRWTALEVAARASLTQPRRGISTLITHIIRLAIAYERKP